MTGGVPAPWLESPGGAAADPNLRDGTIEFADGRVIGPAPLSCAQAVYGFVVMPAEGLFQGGLQAPAEGRARVLGISRFPVLTLLVRCDAGVFDYHFAAPDRLLTALDNTIWTLVPVSSPEDPAEVVQALLAEHLTGSMEFSAATVARKERYLSPFLLGAVADYFRRQRPADEPPPIDGDPFTDSQEYPDRFAIVDGEAADGNARVGVRFGSGDRERTVTVVLIPSGGGRLVDDIHYDDGSTLRELLAGG